jgi:adenylate cyclase
MTHAFLFADLCGYTEYTRRNGDLLAAELALAFHHRAYELAAEEGCDVVKSIGDAVMVRADDGLDALRFALRLLALSETEPYPPIRAGIDVGPAIERAGDWFGATVNTAARVTAAAPPGELVITERARRAMHDHPEFTLLPLGASRLKGLPEMRLHAAAIA